LGPLGTAATNRPTVPAPDDYDDGEIGGMMIGRGNRSIRREPAPVPLCSPQTPHSCLDANPGRRGGKRATNRLSYGTAFTRQCQLFETQAYFIYKTCQDFTLLTYIPDWGGGGFEYLQRGPASRRRRRKGKSRI
jgi:hypothetical protein